MSEVGTVLAIDDRPELRKLYTVLLGLKGYETIVASNGASGLEKMRSKHPDLVICDLRMPGMDGLDVLSQIHEEEPDLPVIVISGEGSVTDVIEALKRGAWDYISKPIGDAILFHSAIERGMLQARLLRQDREYKAKLESLNRDLEIALRQLRTDQEAGRHIQMRLLPPDRSGLGDYEFSQRLFPSLYLSGDFIDYFVIDDEHLGFYMADVSGHGAASAFVTVMLKTLMDGYRHSLVNDGDPTILDPGAVLGRVDRDLGRLQLDKHLTMFYGVIDQNENELEYSNGGHYPYPILFEGSEAQTIECPGSAIALLPNASFRNRTLKMQQNSRLLLASDGVLELLPHSTLREKSEALRLAVAGVQADMNSVASDLGIDPDQELLDDIAILLVERTRHE